MKRRMKKKEKEKEKKKKWNNCVYLCVEAMWVCCECFVGVC